jgi:hypothetical protein
MLTRFFSVVTVDALEGPYFRTVTFPCASNDVSPLIALRAMNRGVDRRMSCAITDHGSARRRWLRDLVVLPPVKASGARHGPAKDHGHEPHRHVTRPSFAEIEGDHTYWIVKLARHEIVNNGVEVGSLFGRLTVRATGVAEVIEHDVHRDIGLVVGR